MEVQVNWLAVFLASVAGMVVGFLWYSPSLFGKPWMKLMGMSADSLKKEQKQMGKYYGLSFVVSIITAMVLSHVMTFSDNFYHYARLTTGLATAFWMWFGFMMPVQLTGEIFGGKNWRLFAINTGYQLASLLVMGVVIATIT